MALVKCTDCGIEISENAKSCPFCGCPMDIIKKNGANKSASVKGTSRDATAILQKAIQSAKAEVKSAEALYDQRERELQAKASRSIDLFSGNATSRAVEIASMARDMCDDLYATYQTLIKRIDAACRPQLENKPDAAAIQEVAEYIAFLNSESKISNNFSASYNQRDLGQFASGQYLPSMDCRMIEKFWTDTYQQTPEHKEAERIAEHRKQEQEKAKDNKYEAEMKSYNKLIAQYDAAVKKIDAERKQRIESSMKKREEWLRKDIQKTFEATRNKAEMDQKNAEERISKAKTELEGLGFFKFGEKRRQKEIVATAESDLAQAKESWNSAETKRDAALADLEQQLLEDMKNLSEQVEKELAYPVKPKHPKPPIEQLYNPANGGTLKMTGSERLKMDILEFMEPERFYTVQEIYEAIEYNDDFITLARTAALLTQLKNAGVIRREEIARKAYFGLVL